MLDNSKKVEKEQEARQVVAAGKVPFSDEPMSYNASTAAESAAESAAAPNTSCITTALSYPFPAPKRSGEQVF